MRQAFEERRDWIVPALNAIPGIKCTTPGGAFYVFPNVSALYGKNWTPDGDAPRTLSGSDDFAAYLLEKYEVALK